MVFFVSPKSSLTSTIIFLFLSFQGKKYSFVLLKWTIHSPSNPSLLAFISIFATLKFFFQHYIFNFMYKTESSPILNKHTQIFSLEKKNLPSTLATPLLLSIFLLFSTFLRGIINIHLWIFPSSLPRKFLKRTENILHFTASYKVNLKSPHFLIVKKRIVTAPKNPSVWGGLSE